jgi:cysteinyl-tRNA synthetase
MEDSISGVKFCVMDSYIPDGSKTGENDLSKLSVEMEKLSKEFKEFLTAREIRMEKIHNSSLEILQVIQELKTIIDHQKTIIDDQKKEIDELKKKNNELLERNSDLTDELHHHRVKNLIELNKNLRQGKPTRFLPQWHDQSVVGYTTLLGLSPPKKNVQ